MISRACLTTSYFRRVRTLFVQAVTTTLPAGALSACGDDPAGPEVLTIVGTWDLIGFSDAGVEAQTSGSWTFRADGTHSFEGTVTFPDEPPENISGEGAYEQTGTTLELTVGTESTAWTLEISGDVATLTESGPLPANEITLRRT